MKNIVKSLLVGTLSAGALAVCAEDKTVFNYHEISKALCGKTGSMNNFQLNPFIVIQMN